MSIQTALIRFLSEDYMLLLVLIALCGVWFSLTNEFTAKYESNLRFLKDHKVFNYQEHERIEAEIAKLVKETEILKSHVANLEWKLEQTCKTPQDEL